MDLITSMLCAGMAAGSLGAVVMPWDMEALSKPPQSWPAPEFSEDGVRALFFEGIPYQGKPTRVFAWYGAPEGDGPFPAMVLVHGGGGTAFAEWVRLWTSRGYAAIAMDTCGCVPRGEYGNWERHPEGGPGGWGGFHQIDEPVADQWTCQAVASIVLAHSLIRSFPEVDADRTGITGISWGGYLTCIAAGVDSRFKLAVPVYGCGFLGEDSVWLPDFANMGPDMAGRWLSLWDPSVWLPRARMPFLWVTGTNDFAYPMNSLQMSYRLPPGPRQLCVTLRMPHGHGGAGENPVEIRAFADHHFLKKPALPRVTAQGTEDGVAWMTFEADVPVEKAELLFTKATGTWQEREWEAVPADLDPEARRASAALPESATAWYLNLVDSNGCVISGEHAEAAPAPES
jgi:dienelactone hydrolase